LPLLELSAKATDLDEKLVKDLLDITPKENINMTYQDKRTTLLHIASSYYSKDIIGKILNNGGDIMAGDETNKMPLQLGIENGNSKFYCFFSVPSVVISGVGVVQMWTYLYNFTSYLWPIP
jgi:hypothetical protein